MYEPLLQPSFSMEVNVVQGSLQKLPSIGGEHRNMVSMQKQIIALAKKNQNPGVEDGFGDPVLSKAVNLDEDFSPPKWVDMPLVMQGPGAYAWHLLQKASCSEEQIDAVSLLA